MSKDSVEGCEPEVLQLVLLGSCSGSLMFCLFGSMSEVLCFRFQSLVLDPMVSISGSVSGCIGKPWELGHLIALTV